MSIPQSGGGPIEHHDQMAQYLADGCKPKEDWRIGTEHEKFGYCTDTHKPLPYEGDRSIRVMLEGLRDRHGWAPVEEGGKLIGLEKEGANISLEPGGQLELSGAPVETIHETCDEVNTLDAHRFSSTSWTGLEASDSRITSSAPVRSAPTAGNRGARTLSDPRPTSCWTSLIS